MTETIKSVSKAAAVLQAFSSHRRVMTVRQISAQTDVSKSTCHSICVTLVEAGLLEPVHGGGFQLGASLVGMAGPVIERLGLAEAGTPAMMRLTSLRTGEVHLGQLASPWIVYLARMRMHRRVPMRNWMGLRVPMCATACGRAVLSQLTEEVAANIVGSQTDHGYEAYRDVIELASSHGYAVCDSFQPGVRSVASAILDYEGSVVGAVSVAQPQKLLDARRTAYVGAQVNDEAAKISSRLRSTIATKY